MRSRGRITKVIPVGYAFAKSDTGESVFIHATAMKAAGAFEELKRGCVVDFEPVQGPDGRPRGVDVVILERPEHRR